MDNIISAQNIIFDFEKETEEGVSRVRALDGVSADVERGSFVAVIGMNGSGKSTLAKNMNALFVPTEGTVYVNGFDTRDESKLWEIRRTAGMVFQNPDNQLVSAIVEDDVAFGPENLGVPTEEIRERVDAALKAVGMYDYRESAPHLLSGGQKQRIAIAGIYAMRPECMIFDEPTAMLDPSGKRGVMDIIREMNGRGITVVLITHFMDEAALADRIIVMNRGKVELEGTPEEVFSRIDMLRELGLTLPMAVDLAERLRARGIDVPRDIVTADALAEYVRNAAAR